MCMPHARGRRAARTLQRDRRLRVVGRARVDVRLAGAERERLELLPHRRPVARLDARLVARRRSAVAVRVGAAGGAERAEDVLREAHGARTAVHERPAGGDALRASSPAPCRRAPPSVSTSLVGAGRPLPGERVRRAVVRVALALLVVGRASRDGEPRQSARQKLAISEGRNRMVSTFWRQVGRCGHGPALRQRCVVGFSRTRRMPRENRATIHAADHADRSTIDPRIYSGGRTAGSLYLMIDASLYPRSGRPSALLRFCLGLREGRAVRARNARAPDDDGRRDLDRPRRPRPGGLRGRRGRPRRRRRRLRLQLTDPSSRSSSRKLHSSGRVPVALSRDLCARTRAHVCLPSSSVSGSALALLGAASGVTPPAKTRPCTMPCSRS